MVIMLTRTRSTTNGQYIIEYEIEILIAYTYKSQRT
jgi:hypothetical protein